MNTVNRVVVICLLLLLIALCTLVLIVPVPFLNALSIASGNMARSLGNVAWYVLLPAGLLIALMVNAAMVLLLYLELRRPSLKTIRVASVGGGEVELNVASVADRLRQELCALPFVVSCTPHVTGQGKGVMVRLDVETIADIVVPDQSAEILETAQRVLEGNLGLKLARPIKASLRIAPPQRGERQVVPPAPPPQPGVSEAEAVVADG
ncbi:MAG: alkaline shock response membrane anchor protein AmaP [Anaerolineae bacterium]|nr:alkaline shock response membrane anchor protein AmaP [Anaerolineae bacterium]